MSITKETTIWCDGEQSDGNSCAHWEQDGGTAKTLRKDLARKGWSHKDGKDFCPSCSRENRKAIK